MTSPLVFGQGYGLFGHCVVLLVTYNIHFHFLFYILWLLLGGLSTLRMVRLSFPSSPVSPQLSADVCFIAFGLPLGGGSAVPHCGSDSSPAALWDSGSAAHAVSALPALYLPQDCRGSDTCHYHHVIVVVTLHLTLTLPVSVLSGILDTLEGPNMAPIQRVLRDVPEVILNTTARSLGALLKSQ